MNQVPGDPIVRLRAETMLPGGAEPISTCPRCGTKMPASRPTDRCPVCQLRDALDPDIESDLTGAAGSSVPAAAGKRADGAFTEQI